VADDRIDITLGAPLGRKTNLRVTPEHIQWGDHTVTLARVEHVACYWAEMSVNFVRASRHVQCWFADDRDEVSITTGAGRVASQEQRLAEAAAALEHALFETVAPRLVGAAVAQLRGGGEVTIGGLEVIKSAVGGGVSSRTCRASCRSRPPGCPAACPTCGRSGYGARRVMSRGNSVTSRTLAAPHRRATHRSSPRAKPPCGGMPWRNAAR